MPDTVVLNATLVTFVASVLIPLVTSLVTKLSASPKLKQFITGVLSLATGVLVAGTQLDGTAILSKEALVTAGLTFGMSILVYVGILKPNNVAVLPDKGLGRVIDKTAMPEHDATPVQVQWPTAQAGQTASPARVALTSPLAPPVEPNPYDLRNVAYDIDAHFPDEGNRKGDANGTIFPS